MANKKPLTQNKSQILDADNLLLPSMTITDGTNIIDISTDISTATHNHNLVNLSDVDNTALADGYILKWDAANSKYIFGENGVHDTYGFSCGGLTTNYANSQVNIIDYIIINTTSANATDVGDLAYAVSSPGGSSSNAYGWIGGGKSSSGSVINNIQYIDITIVTQNAVDGGDLTKTSRGCSGVNGYNGYNYYVGGLDASNNYLADMQYVDNTTSSANAVSYGSLSYTPYNSGTVSNNLYGFVAGGWSPSNSTYNIINYFDDTTTSGSGTDRGDLTQARAGLVGVSGSNYGFYCSGSASSGSYENTIDYIEYVTTTTNAVDRGDLTLGRLRLHGLFHSDIGVLTGGYSSSGVSNVMDYIDLTLTTGNASDRGDLTVSRWRGCGCSG